MAAFTDNRSALLATPSGMSILPDWFEKYRIPDDWSEAAYESTPASLRALVKTGIALAYFHFGSAYSSKEQSIENIPSGFSQSVKIRPVDWSLLIFSSEQKSAARISSAAILPRLAGVEEVFTICTESQPGPPLLTSLTLCGVEDIFSCDKTSCASLIKELAKKGTGRIHLAHEGSLTDLYLLACEYNIPAFNECRKPALLLASPDYSDRQALEFCLGELPETEASRRPFWDCVYGAKSEIPARLHLALPCMGFWLFENCGLDFYLSSEWSFAPVR